MGGKNSTVLSYMGNQVWNQLLNIYKKYSIAS